MSLLDVVRVFLKVVVKHCSLVKSTLLYDGFAVLSELNYASITFVYSMLSLNLYLNTGMLNLSKQGKSLSSLMISTMEHIAYVCLLS